MQHCRQLYPLIWMPTSEPAALLNARRLHITYHAKGTPFRVTPKALPDRHSVHEAVKNPFRSRRIEIAETDKHVAEFRENANVAADAWRSARMTIISQHPFATHREAVTGLIPPGLGGLGKHGPGDELSRVERLGEPKKITGSRIGQANPHASPADS